MRTTVIIASLITGIAGASPQLHAQTSFPQPGAEPTSPVTSGSGTGAGSKLTGAGESGRGAAGGALTKDSSDGAGTSMQGNPGRQPSQSGR